MRALDEYYGIVNLISLNIWGGRAGRDKLIAFMEAHKEDTDIFNLQEVWSGPYKEMEGMMAGGVELTERTTMHDALQTFSQICADHVPYFVPMLMDDYGLLMLVHKRLTVTAHGEEYVYRERGYRPDHHGEDLGHHARCVQYATMHEEGGVPFTVMNLHGLWNGKGKEDCEERFEQSRRVCALAHRLATPYVLAGDLNLLPDSESISMLEACGMRNLIREYGVTSTRSSHYKKENKFADYALVSHGIRVEDFRVLADEVSDHLPLALSFALD